MAQLIKLLDYVSRYESNPFHYPGQFIRLKQENWLRLNKEWEKEQMILAEQAAEEAKKEQPRFRWNPFAWKKNNERSETIRQGKSRTLPATETQLVQYFLNELYPFQLKWATTTLTETSYTDPKFNHDHQLKYFLQRFPDIYLLMYYPIFNVKNAPIDGEIILISPIGIDVIVLMEEHPTTEIIVSDDRMWSLQMGESTKSIVSPTISLRRTEQIIKGILNRYEINFPISKTVLSKTNHITYTSEPYQTSIVGKREYEAWFEQKRSLSSSLKNIQLRVIEALLIHCQTTSVQRPEWRREEQDSETIATFGDK